VTRKSAGRAQPLDIPKAYGSYEELLADADVDTIYNPSPNHEQADIEAVLPGARRGTWV